MLRRFVSGAAVAAVAVACAAAILLNLPSVNRASVFPLVVLWLCAPAAWGVWAMLTPPGWAPRLLPAWGAVLGAVLGGFAAVVFNLPLVVFGVSLNFGLRLIGIPVAAALYFLLWIVVRRVYVELGSGTEVRERARAA